VKRTEIPKQEFSDYIVQGIYDFSEERTAAPFYHSITVKGKLHVSVERVKDSTKILDKDFLEERMDNGASFKAIRVLYLQEAFLITIASEIKKAIVQDVSNPSGSNK